MLTKEEAINKLNEIKRNTQHNGYMWASDVEDMFYKIYDEHESKLVHLKHIEDEVILLRNNRKDLEVQLKAKDEEIERLKEEINKMKCCENCEFSPNFECSFNTQYGCLDDVVPSNWKVKGNRNV